MEKVSVIVPAFNEEDILEETLLTLKEAPWFDELLIVNDGSTDKTEIIAKHLGDLTISFGQNVGKGKALQAGWEHARGDIIVTLDADLGKSANEGKKLLAPLTNSAIDFTIARLPKGDQRGFGLMRRRVQKLIWKQTGQWISAPLSGQRAFKKKWLPVLLKKQYYRFAVETMMTIDLLKAGANVCEVDTAMSHRYTGKDLHGFLHRGTQWIQMERAVRGLR